MAKIIRKIITCIYIYIYIYIYISQDWVASMGLSLEPALNTI